MVSVHYVDFFTVVVSEAYNQFFLLKTSWDFEIQWIDVAYRTTSMKMEPVLLVCRI